MHSPHDLDRRTQLATICKCLPTVFAFVRLVTSVTALVAVQGRLSSKRLATDGATEVFVCILTLERA